MSLVMATGNLCAQENQLVYLKMNIQFSKLRDIKIELSLSLWVQLTNLVFLFISIVK